MLISPAFDAVFVFLFGLVVGSFLNVCIWRLPKGESIVRPSSKCPTCGAGIKPYDNIPLVSWLILGGKCRVCRARISTLYPVVELATGLLFVACHQVFGLTVTAAKWAVFSGLLVVLVIVDARERILPDGVNFTGLGLGLAFSLFRGPEDGTAQWMANKLFAYPPPEAALGLVDALLGAAVGSGLLWVVAEGYFRLRRREGMGLGDVKMMALIGAFLGLKRTLLTILAGSLIGSVVGLVIIGLWKKRSDYELPFGTFLGGAALLVLYFGGPLLEWYTGLLSMP